MKSKVVDLYDTFLQFYSECDYLNHIIFTGSFDKKTVSKVYSCKDLFELEESLSVERLYDGCMEELINLIKEFNTLGSEVHINISLKKFNIDEKMQWCQKNPNK